MSSTITALTSGGGLAMAGDTSGQLELKTNNGTTAVTIDTTQNFFVNKTAYSDTSGNGFGVFPNSGVPQVSCVGASNSTNKNFTVYSSTDSAYKFYVDYAGNGYFAGNLQFNSGYGSVATAYGVRAWVNFNGTGTVAIRGSGNVSSITDSGTGNYTVNMTTAMPDTNFSCVGGVGKNGGGWSASNSAVMSLGETKSTTSFLVEVFNLNSSYIDVATIQTAVLR